MPFKYEIPKRPKVDDKSAHEKCTLTVLTADGEKTAEVWKGYRLWEGLLDSGADFWKLCGGDGVCGTCRVEVLEGAENLSAPTFVERHSLVVKAFWALHGIFGRSPRWRLACRSYVNGPVKVEIQKNVVQKIFDRLSGRSQPSQASAGATFEV